MPIYEYLCGQCNEKFSLLQKVNSSEEDTECPKCSSKTVKKLMSSFGCSSGFNSRFSSSAPSGGFSGGG